MSLAETPMSATAAAFPNATATPRSTLRDPRLDFFRGIAMFIILIAHVPGNWLTLWIPARFGFSDATEIFVFCSGMASAIAFGAVFRDRGWALGAARVAFRCWQVYWAHIGLFLAVAATMAALNASGAFERDYVGQLNLHPFFNETETNLIGLLTLSYVPNYFDILPMYLVILAMMPFFVALVAVHRGLAVLVVVALWAAAQADMLSLPAEPWSDREWFFNPFGWQLIFFTGFAFMAGWLPVPPVDRRLVILAALIVILIVPFAYFRIIGASEFVRVWRGDYALLIAKTDFGILRYVHFLALAYLAWVAVGPRGARLIPSGAGSGSGHAAAMLWRRGLAFIMKVGQQSLAVFIASMYLARLMGLWLDVLGRNHLTMFAVNLAGALLLVAVAYGAGWFKSQPWRRAKGTP
ncbi:OpgC family protein [Roseivivax sp. CAU 1753]